MSFVVNAVTSVVSGVVNAVGSVVKNVVSAVGSVVSSVLNFVISPFLGLFGINAPNIPNQASTIQGVTVQKVGSDVAIPVIYGFRKVGGIVTFCETGSDSNKYLWVAYVLGEGPIEGVRDIWINDIPVGAGNIPHINNQEKVTLTDADSGKLQNRTILELSKGIATNVGSAVAAGIFNGSPSWTTDMAYNQLAVIFARFEWINATDQASANANPFSGSIPTLQCTVLGRKVTSLTSGTPENNSYSVYDGTYSTNPAEIILDYLRNPQYGKGLNNSDIDWNSFKRSAAKFNQQVTYTVSGVQGPIQTLNAVVDTQQTLFNNTKLLLQNARSYLPYSRTGQYQLIVEDAGNATDILSGSAPIVATFTKDNIIGPITYTGIERTSKFNQVCITYCDPDQLWSQQQWYIPDTASTEHAQYLAEDGGRYNKGDFTFAYITNHAIAADMGRLILQKSRWQDSISFTVTSQGLELQVGDSIYVNSNILKFGTDPNAGAIKWRIVSTKVNNDYSVSLGCVRNIDALYPYVRQQDRDYKLGVYIPTGATRYYPPEPVSIPIGLKPPTYAPTDPNDPNNPTSNTNIHINPILKDQISIFNTVVAQDSNGNYYATMFFNKPNNSSIISAVFYYKPNVSDANVVFSTLERPLGTNDAPNTDGSFSIRLGPLTNGSWLVESRLKYITGDYSSILTTNTFQVGPVGTGGTGGSTTTTPVNPSADFMRTVVGVTNTSGTSPNQLPLNPRQITVTCTQDVSYSGANQFLNGILVYYKPSILNKWYTTTIPVTVTPGTAVTFNLTVGPRLYPLVMPGGAPAGADLWDFIFRYSYSDGTTSKFQYRAINQHVEDSGFSYAFNLFVPGMGTIYPKEDSGSVAPQLLGPGDTIETRNIVTPAYQMREIYTGTTSAPTNQSIRLFIAPPVASDIVNWVGVRVYLHKAGTSGTGTSQDFTPANFSGAPTNAYSVLITGITFDDNWEFVVTDLVYYGNATVEAFNGQYMFGYVHPRVGDADYPSDTNWLKAWQVNAMESLATAKAKLGTAAAKAIRTDTYFDSVSATPILTSGHPSSPRKLSFTVKTSTVNGTNGHVAKIRIYYKYNSNVYWNYSDYASTAENTTVTFASNAMTPAMDLGGPSYPAYPYHADDYDFYFRIVYTDGTASQYSPGFIQVNVEDDSNNGSYSYQVFGNRLFQPLNPWKDLTLVANAPPGAVVDPRNLVLNLTRILDNGTGATSGRAQFIYTMPVGDMLPYFGGIRIYRRDLTPGVSTNYTVNNDNQPLQVFSTDYATGYAYQSINWDTTYAYLLVPMVWYQGVLTEANNALYWQGAIHNRVNQTTGLNPYPGAGQASVVANWLSKSAATSVVTATQLASLSKPVVVANPVVTISSLQYISGTDRSQSYYQVQYIKPATTVSVSIYRRTVYLKNTSGGIYYNPIQYYGAGRWEKLDISDGGIANGSTVTVNLRDPTSQNEFNAYYDPTYATGITLPNTSYAGGAMNYLYANGSMTAPTNLSLNGGGAFMAQLLFVVTYTDGTSNFTSTQAIQADMNYNIPIPGPNTTLTIGVNSNTYLTNVADYNTITTVPASTNGVSLMRKLSEARSPVSISNIIKPGTYNTIGGWTYPSVTPSII